MQNFEIEPNFEKKYKSKVKILSIHPVSENFSRLSELCRVSREKLQVSARLFFNPTAANICVSHPNTQCVLKMIVISIVFNSQTFDGQPGGRLLVVSLTRVSSGVFQRNATDHQTERPVLARLEVVLVPVEDFQMILKPSQLGVRV